MSITYKDTHDFSEQDLKDLFLSVEWSSGHFPDKLVVAMKNFKTVISAWDGDKLAFYEHCGFKKADDASAMFITSLWT